MDKTETKKRKKGVINKHNYDSEVRKRSKVQGLEHKTYTGKIIPVRSTGPPCRCAMKCFDKVTEDDRKAVINKFNNCDSKDIQDCYLIGLIVAVPVKRRRSRNNDILKTFKSSSYNYYVMIDEKRVKVCRHAFISLHGITVMRVRRLSNLLSAGQIPTDLRGKNDGQKKVPEEWVLKIRNHINSFPLKSSHYSSTEKKYLDAKLNIKIMHQLFQEKYQDSPIKYSFYRQYFKGHFDYPFGRPQIDTCGTCEDLMVKIKSQTLNYSAKQVAAAELLVHRRRAKKFYIELKTVQERCKSDKSVLGISFDYMANLSLPNIPVQELFYYNQLTVNVFGIHNFYDESAMFYLYHEGVAKKGSNEVCSFLWDYIKNYVSDEVQHLCLFSDGACGQNKNNVMVRFCLALRDTGRFKTVNQYYPFRGHSWLPCDRDFACAKRLIRRTDRIYSIKQYCELLISSAVNRRFMVTLVSSEMIFNFKDWCNHYYKKNAISVETQSKNIPRNQKVTFTVSTFKQFLYLSGQRAGTVQVKPFINSVVTHTFLLRSSPFGNKVSLPDANAYPDGKVAIYKKKIEDLNKLMHYIPHEYKEFYQNILLLPVYER